MRGYWLERHFLTSCFIIRVLNHLRSLPNNNCAKEQLVLLLKKPLWAGNAALHYSCALWGGCILSVLTSWRRSECEHIAAVVGAVQKKAVNSGRLKTFSSSLPAVAQLMTRQRQCMKLPKPSPVLSCQTEFFLWCVRLRVCVFSWQLLHILSLNVCQSGAFFSASSDEMLISVDVADRSLERKQLKLRDTTLT